MINQLRTQALEVWGDIHPGLAKPSTLDYLLQSRDHIVIFWFARGNGSRQPVLISKLPRHKLFNYYLERSIQMVDQLKANLQSPVVETIPVRIHAGQVNQLFHMVMSAMPGDPLKIPGNGLWGRRTAESQIDAYLNWLQHFQSQSLVNHQNPDWASYLAEHHSQAPFEFLDSAQFHPVNTAIIQQLSPNSIPITWGYGDAHHSNILMQKGRISGAIDWIGIEDHQWFHVDWYYFLFSYAIQFFKKNSNHDASRQLKLAISTSMGSGDHWLSDLFQDKTRQFLESNAIPPGLSPELFLTFLHHLHWPEDKPNLLRQAYTIYSQSPLL